VSRANGQDTLLFDSSFGATILGDSMSEISLYLPRNQVYGPAVNTNEDDISLSFYGNNDFASKSLYTLDPWTREGRQHAHPYFMAMDLERNFFGVMLESNGLVTVEVQPGVNGTRRKEPMLVFRHAHYYHSSK